MRPKGLLSLNVDLINLECSTDAVSFQRSDTTYRQEGISIGADYLRIEGKTVSRGSLSPSTLFAENAIFGRGAFSTVRRATWKNGNTVETAVAVKEYTLLELTSSSSRQRRKMLLTELRALCHIANSPALVQMHGAFLYDDQITLVLEFMDKGSLHDIIDERRQKKLNVNFPQKIISAMAYSLLMGLSFLHKNGILHRDLKPGNVLLHSDGSVKLGDFGMAALHDEQHTTVLGTPRFMAPERLRAHPYGRASDIWSLGLILLECTLGHEPFDDVVSMVELVVAIEDTPLDELIPSFAERGLAELLRGCLRIEPEKRIPASVLVQSPWFAETHGYTDLELSKNAVKRLFLMDWK